MMIRGIWADIIIATYILITLALRIIAEPALENHPLISVAVGFVLLALLWSLIKVEFLVPNYFGLFNKSRKKK